MENGEPSDRSAPWRKTIAKYARFVAYWFLCKAGIVSACRLPAITPAHPRISKKNHINQP
jgi:hypothetical protein